MARLGNGADYGPSSVVSCGTGWGGPARGAGTSKAPSAQVFKAGNRKAAGPHDLSGYRRCQQLLEMLYTLAMTAESQDVQVSAAVAWLNRVEGKPVARTINVALGDSSALEDAALATIVLRST